MVLMSCASALRHGISECSSFNEIYSCFHTTQWQPVTLLLPSLFHATHKSSICPEEGLWNTLNINFSIFLGWKSGLLINLFDSIIFISVFNFPPTKHHSFIWIKPLLVFLNFVGWQVFFFFFVPKENLDIFVYHT